MDELTHTFKVPDVHCSITGTDDYGDGTYEICKQCTYRVACQAKHDDLELAEAKELYYESLKYASEAEILKKQANELFAKVIKDNSLIKYQFDNLMIQDVYVKESKTYPKAKLLKAFTLEQLEPAAEIKEAYHYLRIDDLLKEKKKKDD
jgi:hypothetical protein